MLSNAYQLGKFRFDTAENEPAKIRKIELFEFFSKKLLILLILLHRCNGRLAARLGALGAELFRAGPDAVAKR